MKGFAAHLPAWPLSPYSTATTQHPTPGLRPVESPAGEKQLRRENPRLKLSHPPLSSTHASYLQGWADRQSCATLSPAPPAPHSLGKETCVWLSGRSRRQSWLRRNIRSGHLNHRHDGVSSHTIYHRAWGRLYRGSSRHTAGCWGCPAKPALTRPSWRTHLPEPKTIREAIDPRTFETGGSCQELLTDKTCCISLVSLPHVSACLKWNRSLMKLSADETLTLFSPGNTFETSHNHLWYWSGKYKIVTNQRWLTPWEWTLLSRPPEVHFQLLPRQKQTHC